MKSVKISLIAFTLFFAANLNAQQVNPKVKVNERKISKNVVEVQKQKQPVQKSSSNLNHSPLLHKVETREVRELQKN